MTIRPVGAGASVNIAGTAQTSSAFNVQTNTLRVVARVKGAHVVIGTDPIATNADFYVAPDEPETLAMTKASQRIQDIDVGTATTITCPEGTQMPFGVGDRVTVINANDTNYNTVINHAEVTSVNTTAGFDGNFQTSITVDADTSGISTAFTVNSGAQVVTSLKISVLQGAADGGGGALYYQQVQRT